MPHGIGIGRRFGLRSPFLPCEETNLEKTLLLEDRDDEKANWDTELHMYILRPEWIKAEINFAVMDDKAIKELLKELAEKLKMYVKDKMNRYKFNYRIIEWRLANQTEFRTQMIRALLSYFKGAVRSDIDQIGDNHGIDFRNNTRVSLVGAQEIPRHTRRLLMDEDVTILEQGELLHYCISEEDYRSDY